MAVGLMGCEVGQSVDGNGEVCGKNSDAVVHALVTTKSDLDRFLQSAPFEGEFYFSTDGDLAGDQAGKEGIFKITELAGMVPEGAKFSETTGTFPNVGENSEVSPTVVLAQCAHGIKETVCAYTNAFLFDDPSGEYAVVFDNKSKFSGVSVSEDGIVTEFSKNRSEEGVNEISVDIEACSYTMGGKTEPLCIKDCGELNHTF